MSKKGSQGGSNDNAHPVIPFDDEKEKFMGMIGDVLSNKNFSSPEEANKFLNEAFTGRSMSDSLSEWDTRPSTPLDEARQVIDEMPHDSTPETKRRYAKKALGISEDCMEAWGILAWSYQSQKKIESTLIDGLAHGRVMHADLIAGVGVDHGLWGHHETRPFMRLFEDLANLYNEDGAAGKAITVYEEMMTLNPGDNQGIRGSLLHRYLLLNRLDDAEKFLKRLPDDLDLGIVYGRVLFELMKVLETGYDFDVLGRKGAGGRLSPSAFGPPLAKARARMKEALKINPYVPILMAHPTSFYVEPPATYQFGSPDQAMIFVNDHGVDWVGSMVGWLFLTAFETQAKILIKKAKRPMRESYKDLLDYLNGIEQIPWQKAIVDGMKDLS